MQLEYITPNDEMQIVQSVGMVQLKFIILKVFIVKRILIFIIQINTIKKIKLFIEI